MTASLALHAAGHGRRTASPAAPARNAFLETLAGIADGWRAWARYKRLSAMSDARLAALGLARGDIARHAVSGVADGRRT